MLTEILAPEFVPFDSDLRQLRAAISKPVEANASKLLTFFIVYPELRSARHMVESDTTLPVTPSSSLRSSSRYVSQVTFTSFCKNCVDFECEGKKRRSITYRKFDITQVMFTSCL